MTLIEVIGLLLLVLLACTGMMIMAHYVVNRVTVKPKDHYTPNSQPTYSHWTDNPAIMKDERRQIVVDFDHTILRVCPACASGQYFLQDGAGWGMRQLESRGFYIIVFTARPVEDIPDIKAFLDGYNIPYDELRVDKPPAYLSIDDRAVYHKGWVETIGTVDERYEKDFKGGQENDMA